MKKTLNRKVSIVIMLILVTLIGSVYFIIRVNNLKHIDKSQIDINKYVDSVDEISANKVQVNWKEVCAIVATLNNNKLDKVSENEIKEISKRFIDENNNLNSLESVMNDLYLNELKVKMVYTYLDDLDNYGFHPDRLNKNSKYTKFIKSIKNGAKESYEKYKILPSITIAQAILETGWGQSELSSKYNNLFGIKANSSWEGDYVTLETKEFSDTIIDDKFRKYDNKNDSINDHGKFLYENTRYRNYGVFDANTYIYQANALQDAGYSTHMNDNGEKIYAKQLIELIKQYNLQLIDNEVQGE